jgi:hypothetical protein
MLRALLIALTLALPLVAAAETPQPEPARVPWPFARGRIGVQVQPMTPELRAHFGAPEDRGVLVVRVEPGRPAAVGGVEVGDIVLEANGEAVDSPRTLALCVHRLPEGEKLELSVLRDGERRLLPLEPEPPEDAWEAVERWRGRLERGLEQGSDALERRLEEIERRLKELERRYEERLDGRGGERT